MENVTRVQLHVIKYVDNIYCVDYNFTQYILSTGTDYAVFANLVS